ncbi:MAG: cbb3-type cytochrome c oxidase subunit I [Acidimicrobiia bacterium]|nr:cbb3-type cytochrome c oxidase subunit I [Acidimicrobiia bacterium]
MTVSEITEEVEAPAADERPVARLQLIVAGLFLVFGVLGLLIISIQLVSPGFLGGVGFLSYGRMLPNAMSDVVNGWLVLGSIAAAFAIVPRVTGVPLARPTTAMAALGLTTLGYLTGGLAVLFGGSEGRYLLELPLWADAIVLLGLVAAARVVSATAGKGRDLAAPAWFFVAAMWWLVLLHIVGNIPGVVGVNSAILTAFYRAGLVGMFFAIAGLGIVAYLIPAETGATAPGNRQLTRLGFWSLAFVWAWTAPRFLVFSPAPDWYETIGTMFSIGLVVPALIVLADIAVTMRGSWERAFASVPLKFALAGAGMFALAVIVNLFQSLRSVGGVVQFTEWMSAYDWLLFLGAFSFWLFAFGYHELARHTGSVAVRAATWHLRLSTIGLALALGSMWVAGLQQGLYWVGAANAQEALPVGDGAIGFVAPLAAHHVVRVVGIGLYLVGALVFLGVLLRRGASVAPIGELPDVAAETPDESPAEEETVEEDMFEDIITVGPMRRRRVTIGAVSLFAVSFLFVGFFPMLEGGHSTPTLLADQARDYEGQAAEGRRIYLAEGCWYCHTQQVRTAVTDVGLGGASLPGDYAYEVPALFGEQRMGPDLMHVAERGADAGALAAHLADPQASKSWSTMPSYDYLSDADMSDLVAYLGTLED